MAHQQRQESQRSNEVTRNTNMSTSMSWKFLTIHTEMYSTYMHACKVYKCHVPMRMSLELVRAGHSNRVQSIELVVVSSWSTSSSSITLQRNIQNLLELYTNKATGITYLMSSVTIQRNVCKTCVTNNVHHFPAVFGSDKGLTSTFCNLFTVQLCGYIRIQCFVRCVCHTVYFKQCEV